MVRMKYLRSVVILSLALAGPGLAQEVAPTPAATPSPLAEPVESVANMTDGTLGLAWGGPTRLTASATLMWGAPKMLGAFAPGKLAQVRVGTGGGQLALGFVAGVFEDSLVRPSGVAVTLKAIALRTWRDPTGITNGHTYAGVESDVVLLGFRGSLGYAWKVAGTGGPDRRFLWALGLGL